MKKIFFEKLTHVNGEILDKWTLQGRLEYMKDVLQQLDKPFIMAFTGIPTLDLTSKHHTEKVYDVEDYLLSLSNIEGGKGSGYLKLEAITNEDVEWTKQRNEGLQYTAYRKFTLKPDIQDVARTKFEELIYQIENALNQLEQNENKQRSEKNKRKSLYRIGKIYKEQLPKGGENGTDGFLDVEIINNKTGESTRMIYRDVFDFGIYCFPKRVGNTSEVFERSAWSKEELNVSSWLAEFGGFSNHIRQGN